MRTVVAASFVAATLLVPAAAEPRVAGCAVVTDPARDVVVVAAGTPVPAALDDAHADLRAVRIESARNGLVVTFANTAIDQRRRAIWRLTLRSGRASLYVEAGTGVWVNVGNGDTLSGFRAGVTGRESRPVAGSIDYGAGAVRVQVPFGAFGSARPRAGTVFSGFAAETKETLVTVAPAPGTAAETKLTDTAASAKRFTVGRTC